MAGSANFWLIVWISIVFTINNLVVFSVWAVIGDGLATAWQNDADARKLNLIFGVTLAPVAV
ncbi:MAG: hypothetical protein HKN05_16680 [Rhizobiales bacterium]|nr:hypothetical protein [Hyphomicrobiales bacterium]